MIVDGLTKRCSRCGSEKPMDEFYADRTKAIARCSKCKVCDRELARARYLVSNPDRISHAERRLNPVHKPTSTSNRTRWRIAGEKPRMCKDCATVEVARPLWLCADCKRLRLLARAGATHRRRARLFGVEYEPIDRDKVCERDAWRCGICHRKIRPDLAHPHPRSASLDHIVPMSLGGPHLYSNVQPAHLECNLVKGHRGSEFQPLLFG